MTKKLAALLATFVMIVSLAACGAGEETTISGMVTAVNGTQITLVEMGLENMGSMDFAEGERPEMPEGMEGFQGFGGFNPEDFEGEMPERGDFPQPGGEMPEDFTLPEDFEMPEGFERPEDSSMPEGFEMPEGGMPGFGGQGGMNFENFASEAETTTLDISEAHISVEIDGGKESGSLDSIQPGSFVTVTVNGKGEATYVLVSSQSFFSGRGFAN